MHAVFSSMTRSRPASCSPPPASTRWRFETGTIPVRVDPPADLFWKYVQSTPLAAALAGLDYSARAALERDVVERCQPLVDGDATVMEPGVLVVTGRRIRN